jgi:hypothetical protein
MSHASPKSCKHIQVGIFTTDSNLLCVIELSVLFIE